ncbi:hypothetical protein OYT88_12650 [Sporolactobacillus sp. CQH2019]|uniref:hypothetical protein n=1 Tax=Sporolactobacillus sp. CQH2019 TaxID=3023512 RepID=UPI0023674243|nr:hypothetical protein [Sporolactobacillus sp. CQH2019]MDD9149392.1 hypothetical protein [Sporolactobacillus sp. CQH2019]
MMIFSGDSPRQPDAPADESARLAWILRHSADGQVILDTTSPKRNGPLNLPKGPASAHPPGMAGNLSGRRQQNAMIREK